MTVATPDGSAARPRTLFPPSSAPFAAGQIVAGRYRIVTLLGRGGMGEVYRADDIRLGAPVALKFLSPALEDDAAALERLHTEVRVARQVTHPNVCRIHDIGDVDGRHFITMEYVDGEDLATLLRRIGRLPEAKAVEVARQVCAGLHAAHTRGVIHRDLKPANVMIDGDGRARITDFGLAVTGPQAGGEVAGTPAYMAPEQMLGAPATVRSDIYALGLLIYEVCTGHRPFEASTFAEWRQAHAERPPTSPSRRVRDLDPAVERVVLRCLEKAPASRPGSAAEVALALPGGDPVAAALAAGETPSPELVAASNPGGALTPGRGAAYAFLLAATVALLAFTSQPHLHRIVPFDKPPAALADRASTLAQDLGYREPVADRMWAYELDESYPAWEGDPLRGNARWDRLRTGQPATFKFWYRQSPAPFLPLGWPLAETSRENPPVAAEGMVSVVMDPRGRLVEFRGVASAMNAPATPLTADAPPWRTLFAAAGLDMARFAPASPQWTPPVPADGRLAWQGTLADHPDLPVRIEAASLGGRPVYFELAAPWDRPPTAQPEALAGSQVAAAVLAALVIGTVIVGAGWRVRRNLQLGRVDRRGALMVAWTAGLAMAASNLLRGGWSATVQGTTGAMLTMAVGGVFVGSVLWVCYVALEPYVRRHKPQLLVSWTRLLAGGVTDPLVGRDVLLGALLGLGSASSLWVSGWLKVWWSHPLPPNHYVIPETLGSMTLATSVVCGVLGWSLFLNLAVLVFLVVARRIVRREWLAILVFGAVGVSVEVLLYARSAPAIFGAIMNWAFVLWALSRLGLTAGVVGSFVFRLMVGFPITSDPAAAYAPNAWLAMGLVLALGAYGWWASSRAWARRGPESADD